MQTGELRQILIESGIACLFFLIFAFTGSLLLKKLSPSFYYASSSNYSRLFWSFIAGLFIIVSLYAIVVTKGRTVNLFILPLLYFLFKNGNKPLATASSRDATNNYRFLIPEVAFITLVSVLLLHLFPESEYKQADSFFYLKIAESLNATGQENVSHYNNLYSSNFHGMELYHYFELWITALITRFTEGFFPSINVERFITYGILLTGIIVGLYCLIETFTRQKISAAQKLYCFSLLFILPNLLHYFPELYKIFISDFEGNILERPNFRIIYLLFIPVVIELHIRRSITQRSIYLLLLLSVVSFKCTLVIIPSLFLYGLWLCYRKDPAHRFIWTPLVVFSVAFASLYILLPTNKMPSLYDADLKILLLQTVHGWKFILYSIVTSTLYIFILWGLFLLPLISAYKRQLTAHLKTSFQVYLLLVVIGAVGLLMARILYLKDNAYQFLFITHILITVFIWLTYFVILPIKRASKLYILAAIFLSCMWMIKLFTGDEKRVNIFVQNGDNIYEGAKYSAAYLSQVKEYFEQQHPAKGGYLADTTFYKSAYYSRRNPNVYFLPLTYIIASSYNRNIEFCLSDTAAINYEVENPLYKDYLHNAIGRSFFIQYRLRNPELTHAQLVTKFITDNRLSYIIVTKNYVLGNLENVIKRKIIDANTGERFIIL